MKYIKYLYAISFIAAGLTMTACDDDDEIVDIPYVPQSEIGTRLLANSDAVARIYTDTTFVVGLGVTETDIHFLKADGYSTHAFIIDADMNNPNVSVEVSMPYDADVKSNFNRQTLTDMAEYADRPFHRVAAMVNADFWDTGNMDIRGPLHRNGNILKDTFIPKASLPQQALSFIAVTKDNHMVIRDSVEYRHMMYNLKEVTGAGVVVLRDGEISGQTYPGTDPRTCIGYSNDGHVYFLVVDGRGSDTFYSWGINYPDMGSIMKGLGCSWAANLDGGGSTQLLIRHPIANTFQIRNRPTDGAERPVVNGWMVTVKEP